jgi:serine/threonine-protein kinase
VDPGEVLVEASAPGHLPYSTKVKVPAKGRVSVPIPALQASPEPAPVVAPPESAPPLASAPPPQPAAPPPSTQPAPTPVEQRSPIPWIVGGVGIAALGVGTGFGIAAINNADKSRDLCPNGQCHDPAGQTAADHAHTQATISNVSFILGGAAVATGVVLYFTLPTKQSTQVGLVPMADRSSLGLTLRGKLEL